MNVFVVDDEPIIRQVLKTMIDWEQYGLCWAGEASDGAAAWEQLQTGGIDLVVTDILMPRMDGLELVKRMNAAELDVAVIVLSCLDDFSYVKEAMKQGARDYILKPTMEPEQLIGILAQARDDLQKRREEKRLQLELRQELLQSKQAQWGIRLHRLWTSGHRDEVMERVLFSGKRALVCWMIYFSPDVRLSHSGWQWPDALASVSITEHRLLLLYEVDAPVNETDPGTGGRQAQLAAFLSGSEGGFSKDSYWIAAVPPFHTPEQLSTVLESHEQLRRQYFYSSERSRTTGSSTFPSVSESEYARNGVMPQEQKQNLLRAVAGHNEQAIVYWAQSVIDRLHELQPPVDAVYSFLHELLGLAAAFVRQQGMVELEDFDRSYVALSFAQAHFQMETLGRWFISACRELAALQSGAMQSASRNPFVRKAVAYMQTHYRQQISTSDIAGAVRLSRSYLSDLYGKETGETLSETLTRIRIEAAKRLLLAGDNKVYEIAEAAGFTDARAFAKTFKRAVGCTPKEYKEQNK